MKKVFLLMFVIALSVLLFGCKSEGERKLERAHAAVVAAEKSASDAEREYNDLRARLNRIDNLTAALNAAADAPSVLKITVDGVSSYKSNYTTCTGRVKNTGNATYEYVKVKGAFKDISGNVVDTDWTYAVGSEGLGPNESTTFSLSVPKNTYIKTCSVSLLDYDVAQ